MREEEGKRSFEIEVLDDLVLTDGTRLFKSALFIRKGTGNDDFKAAACDTQRNVGTSDEMARFWLKFLGCHVEEEPRVSTQKWFETTVRFVNECVTDPVDKTMIYEHLLSELNSNRKTVAPRKFVEDYLPDDYRQHYVNFLEENHVSMHSFDKDNADIAGRLRRRSFHTKHGVSVTVPVEQAELVEVETEQIVVHDQLLKIVHK